MDPQLRERLAEAMGVPLDSITDRAWITKETIITIGAELKLDLSYASAEKLVAAVERYIESKTGDWHEVDLYVGDDSLFERRRDKQFAPLSDEAFKRLEGVVYEVHIRVRIHRKTGAYQVLSYDGHTVDDKVSVETGAADRT